MTPILTATPSSPPTYNPGIAETFSWIPIEGADRPLFAKATYLTNASDISVTTGDVSLDITPLENLTKTTHTKLDSLTSIQTQKQNEIITLLHGITGTALEVDLNTDQLELHVDGVETLLHDLTASVRSIPSFSVPAYDRIDFEYVGTTDIYRRINYFKNSTQVMALSFVYVTEPPSVGNAIVQSIKRI